MHPVARPIITVIVFLSGVWLALDALNGAAIQAMNSQPLTRLWWLIPGIILLIISYPLVYYYYNKWRHGYHGSRQHDALDQAKRELGKDENNGKK